jgi:hypothetical protein
MRLSYREVKALEIWQKYFSPDIENDYADSQKILESLIDLQQSVVDAKSKMPDWKKWIDTLTTKFVLHTNTLLSISRGTQLKVASHKKEINLIDMPTMLIVFRSQLECFLMFHFIFVQPISQEEKEFRYWNWKYDNLLMRKKIPAHSNFIEIQKKNDLEEIEDLKLKIENSQFFKYFTKNQRKQLLANGSSKLFNSWDDLIVGANLQKKLFYGLYPILSSYAHTGAHSLMNLKEQKLGYHKTHPNCHLFLFLSKMILCLYIKHFRDLFKAAEIKFNLLQQDLQLEIDIYNKFTVNQK